MHLFKEIIYKYKGFKLLAFNNINIILSEPEQVNLNIYISRHRTRIIDR